MNYTENYQLNQWDMGDRIQMEDFNADNAKIDAALAAGPKIVAGTYTGDGVANRTISLGFTPKFVILFGFRTGGTLLYTFVTPDKEFIFGSSTGTTDDTQIVEGGFLLANSNWHNCSGYKERYIACG